jgi:hypothetical protein
MPYVERRDGKVTGLYANKQPGYAEEFLEEDHPELVAEAAAEAAAKAAAEALAVAERTVAEEVRKDAFVKTFLAMTPAEVETYINNNTASLAETRALLKKMALMLLALSKRQLG